MYCNFDYMFPDRPRRDGLHMREISEIRFETDGRRANRELIDRYVLDAVDRLPGLECCDRVAFMPFTDETVGGGNVWLTVAGDREAIVDHEAEHWNTLVEDGLVSEWGVTEVTEDWYEITGDHSELLFRLHGVANQTTKAAFEQFDEPPAPVETSPEDESDHPVGWGTMLHVITTHQEYSLEETMDAFLSGIRQTCEDVENFESPQRAAAHLDECIHRLEALRAEVDA